MARKKGFDKLWRLQVEDKLTLPTGETVVLTARRLTKVPKADREDYANDKARALARALRDKESPEYEKYLAPMATLTKDELLAVLRRREELELAVRVQKDLPSRSPSDTEPPGTMLIDKLDEMERDEEEAADLEAERAEEVANQLRANMADLAKRDQEELLGMAERVVTDGLCQGEWWVAFNDATLRFGIFKANGKPFFEDWPTEADDDLKAALIDLYKEVDEASYNFPT